METIKEEKPKPPFILAMIDLIDACHYADFFDAERYAWIGTQKFVEYPDYDKMVALADRLFWAFNPKAKTQQEWIEGDLGYDVRVYDADFLCVYKAHEKLPLKGEPEHNLFNTGEDEQAKKHPLQCNLWEDEDQAKKDPNYRPEKEGE
jgi:hypothetical protein